MSSRLPVAGAGDQNRGVQSFQDALVTIESSPVNAVWMPEF